MISSEQGIVKTLAFYELFGRPCSFVELERSTGVAPSELLNSINTLTRRGTVRTARGMYFLNDFVSTRDSRTDEISRHAGWKRIAQILPLFAMNPYIKMVAVANSLAFDTTKKGSDIDIFIVAKRKRVYLARLLLVVPLKLLRLRPHETEKNPVCASFIVDEDHVDMMPLHVARDVYFTHWSASLITVYEEKTRGWTGVLAFIFKWCFDYDGMERIAYALERWYLPQTLKSIASLQQGTGTIIAPHMFKAHLHDQREALRDRYEARLVQLGVSI